MLWSEGQILTSDPGLNPSSPVPNSECPLLTGEFPESPDCGTTAMFLNLERCWGTQLVLDKCYRMNECQRVPKVSTSQG